MDKETKDAVSENANANSEEADKKVKNEATEVKKVEEVKETEEVQKSEKAEESQKAEKAEDNTEKTETPKETETRTEPKYVEKMREQKKKTAIPASTLLSTIAIGVSLASIGYGFYTSQNGNIVINEIAKDSNSANFKEDSIANVASEVSASVVSITTETRTESWSGQSSTSTAAGTGFIVSKDGYVITNKHVVDGAKNIEITLDDGTIYKNITVIGTDPINDVAVLKINDLNNTELTSVKLGDSKTVEVGEQVLAIGNALGQYSNSVTSGIVSGKGRTLVATDTDGSTYEKLTDMIQTDAAINGGNSGGPLVNAAGEVIGINTAYASSSNTVGFAIPITAVKGMIENAIATNKVERAVLGVYYTDNSAEIAEEYKLSVTYGAFVYTGDDNTSPIISGGAGDKAGLKEKDLIISVNGAKVGEAGSLQTLIGEYKVGETVKLGVIRDGKTMNIEVKLQAYNLKTE